MKIVKAILLTIFDGIKFLIEAITLIILFSYFFSGCGAFFAILLIENIAEYPHNSIEFIASVFFEVIIVGSWVFFLVLKVEDRYKKIQHEKS